MHSVLRNHRSPIFCTVAVLALAMVVSWGVSAAAGGSVSISSSLSALQVSPPLSVTLQGSAPNGQTNCKYTCIELRPTIKITHQGVAGCATDDVAWCKQIIDRYCNSRGSISYIAKDGCKVIKKAAIQQ